MGHFWRTTCTTPSDPYLWDILNHNPCIARKRNFFRNLKDLEPVSEQPRFFDDNCGPLTARNGEVIPLAPLIVMKYGLCSSSWTLYQPHALIWDYNYWNGKDSFARIFRVTTGKIPLLCGDKIIPPPFLDTWKLFFDSLRNNTKQSKDFDKIIEPLLPMLNCSTYVIPTRVISEKDIIIIIISVSVIVIIISPLYTH